MLQAAPGAAAPEPKLAHGLRFADLYRRDGLARLDEAFLATLQAAGSRSLAGE